jgi:hypothetical protein
MQKTRGISERIRPYELIRIIEDSEIPLKANGIGDEDEDDDEDSEDETDDDSEDSVSEMKGPELE